MSILSKFPLPQRAQVAAKFNSFVETVSKNPNINLVASIFAAAVTTSAAGYVAGCLAGTAVYLFTENQRIENRSTKLETENRELKSSATSSNAQLKLVKDVKDTGLLEHLNEHEKLVTEFTALTGKVEELTSKLEAADKKVTAAKRCIAVSALNSAKAELLNERLYLVIKDVREENTELRNQLGHYVDPNLQFEGVPPAEAIAQNIRAHTEFLQSDVREIYNEQYSAEGTDNQ